MRLLKVPVQHMKSKSQDALDDERMAPAFFVAVVTVQSFSVMGRLWNAVIALKKFRHNKFAAWLKLEPFDR